MTTAREAALRVLERCRRDGAWSAQVLDQLLSSGNLTDRDAALAARLSLGVLQNDRYLDFYIDSFCSAPKLEPKLRDILRLGAFQLLLSDRIPAHAAVGESVALCKASGLSRAAGLVNAVLRRLSENRDRLPEIPGKGTAHYLGVRYSQPDWLAERLICQRGYDFAEAFFTACLEPPETDLQINTLKTDASSYAERLREADIRFSVPEYPDNALSVRSGRVAALPGYAEGLFYVQDRAAAMAVEIAAPKPGMTVLDACAAPGGKSFAAALRMRDEGSILSCDLHGKKLALIESGAKRLGITCIRTAAMDASVFDASLAEGFDLVIADVPCSGFGVMRKKPEIRRKSEAEVGALPAVQARILDNLARYVRPGGTLLYATCTVLREENEELVSGFLKAHPNFQPVDFTVGERRSENGCYTFWPHIDGSDGFFAAKLRRDKA
ncbi:MAG: 16S rRNA (cytosine(967)-C(5))-methyltransferase RsmB [Oscillospiraceae bacterium]|nr:16S rRNA (cytosine(967)-C(5))-methyltransferase RsmB [Oscillospiraceae bacterium]